MTSNCLPIGPIRDGAPFHVPVSILDYIGPFYVPMPPIGQRNPVRIHYGRHNPRRHPHFHMLQCRRNTSANSTSRLRAYTHPVILDDRPAGRHLPS